jgi:hypothetical protein
LLALTQGTKAHCSYEELVISMPAAR